MDLIETSASKRLFHLVFVIGILLSVPTWANIVGAVKKSSDSTAVSGARVSLRRGSATSAVIDSVLTDSAGNYVFANISAGTPNYWLTVVSSGFVNGTRTNLAVADSLVDVTANFFLLTPGTITGFVRDIADSTTPIANAMVIRRRGATVIDTVMTSSTGAYTFTNVAPGTPNYTLAASQSRYLTGTNANVAVPNGGLVTSNFYLSLAVPGSIQGTVFSSLDSTKFIANATLYLRRGSATSAIIDSTTTIATGEYAFGNVSPGTPNYWITVVASGFVNATRNNLNLPNNSTVVANFYMNTPGAIAGKVLDSALGTPIVGAMVLLRRGSATSAVLDTSITDALGSYAFTDVAPGTPNYWLAVSMSNYVDGAATNVVVSNGGSATTNFNLISTLIGDAIFSPSSFNKYGIHFIRLGDQLSLELGVSTVPRTIAVYAPSGKAQWHASVPAGRANILVPAIFAPENGFLYQVK